MNWVLFFLFFFIYLFIYFFGYQKYLRINFFFPKYSFCFIIGVSVSFLYNLYKFTNYIFLYLHLSSGRANQASGHHQFFRRFWGGCLIVQGLHRGRRWSDRTQEIGGFRRYCHHTVSVQECSLSSWRRAEPPAQYSYITEESQFTVWLIHCNCLSYVSWSVFGFDFLLS